MGYTIHTIEELLLAGDNFKLEDVSPDLMTLRIKIHGDQFDGSITGAGSVRISVSGEVIPGAAQRGCPLFFVMQYARPDAIARVV